LSSMMRRWLKSLLTLCACDASASATPLDFLLTAVDERCVPTSTGGTDTVNDKQFSHYTSTTVPTQPFNTFPSLFLPKKVTAELASGGPGRVAPLLAHTAVFLRSGLRCLYLSCC